MYNFGLEWSGIVWPRLDGSQTLAFRRELVRCRDRHGAPVFERRAIPGAVPALRPADGRVRLVHARALGRSVRCGACPESARRSTRRPSDPPRARRRPRRKATRARNAWPSGRQRLPPRGRRQHRRPPPSRRKRSPRTTTLRRRKDSRTPVRPIRPTSRQCSPGRRPRSSRRRLFGAASSSATRGWIEATASWPSRPMLLGEAHARGHAAHVPSRSFRRRSRLVPDGGARVLHDLHRRAVRRGLPAAASHSAQRHPEPHARLSGRPPRRDHGFRLGSLVRGQPLLHRDRHRRHRHGRAGRGEHGGACRSHATDSRSIRSTSTSGA